MKSLLLLPVLAVSLTAQQGPTSITPYPIPAANLQYRSYNYMTYLDGKTYMFDGQSADATIYSNTFSSFVVANVGSATNGVTNLTWTGAANTTSGVYGCAATGNFIPNHSYAANNHDAFLVDGQGHLQRLTTNGTSGPSEPSWNHSGGTTTSGSAVWTDMGIQPPPRHPLAQWWPDPNRKRIYLVGGVCAGSDPDNYNVANLWYWDVAASQWRFAITPHTPKGFLGTYSNQDSWSTAFDQDDNIAVQYGTSASGVQKMFLYCPTDLNPLPGKLTVGQTAAGCVADDWADITATVSGGFPLAHVMTGFKYTKGGKAILFGGAQTFLDGSTTYNETWEYDIPGKKWTRLNDGSANSPPVVPSTNGAAWAVLKGQPAMAWDPAHELIWVYATTTGHFWSLDPIFGGGRWHDQGSPAGAPVCTSTAYTGCTDKMIYDEAENRLVLQAFTNASGADPNDNSTMWVTGTLTPVINGFGASTVTCIDKDGDGYGVGEGCLGPDADDDDASVHSGADVISTYGSLTAFLNRKGYWPNRIWYLATNGNDSTGAVNDPTRPYQTHTAIYNSIQPGDAIVFRGGTWTLDIYPQQGSYAGGPVYYLAYPGEAVIFSGSGATFEMVDKSWLVLDGFKMVQAGSNACLSGGTSDLNTSSKFNHNVYRHIETSHCAMWGLVATNGDEDILVEEVATHDSVAEHGIYFGSRHVPGRNVTMRRVITYKNGRTGIQWNGRVTYLYQDQILAYSNDLTGISWEEGVSRSFLRNLIAFANGGLAQGLLISNYNGNDGDGTHDCAANPNAPGSICPFDQTENLIDHITVYATQNKGYDGSDNSSSGAIMAQLQASCTTAVCRATDLGKNTYQNLALVNYGTNASADQYPPIIFGDGAAKTYFTTSRFGSIVAKQDSGGTAVFGYGAGPDQWGYAPLTCSAAANVTSVSGCRYADPQFVSAATTYSSNPAAFNLRLQSTSPATSGGSVSALLRDAAGARFASVTPAIGAYTGAAAAVVPPANSCDLNGDNVVNDADVQIAISAALGKTSCGSADLDGDGRCTVVDVQRVINAMVTGTCKVGQ